MKKFLLLTGSALLIGLGQQPAAAQDRYAQRPPVVVSPDLSAPWVMQLQRAPVAAHKRQLRKELPGVTMGVAREPVVRNRPRVEARPRRSDIVQTAAVAGAARDVKPAIDSKYLPQTVAYDGPHKPGTIVIDTRENLLYLVEAGGQARRYGVGTGKPGFEWAGEHKVTSKREWPDWRPPAEMIAREKKKGRVLPAHMKGGPENPLGARALYLGSTLYRIHGTNQPWTIGRAVSSGCIRMRNEDVIDLYGRVKVGTRVIVS
ncbi:L,D-transpeptidase [Aquamicrobium sp. LC103]|uniref:L,D-transpeptidase n=1 Tax=Aquamicrobium sp. LC103 TaxID=1120658 RepID=UPI00063E869C|nr:L,D-transpeptidase [Aquamicrobium sp. LC103]TKT69159.1 L,D-transpeptidase [Aquamicrobium sp. LC103]